MAKYHINASGKTQKKAERDLEKQINKANSTLKKEDLKELGRHSTKCIVKYYTDSLEVEKKTFEDAIAAAERKLKNTEYKIRTFSICRTYIINKKQGEALGIKESPRACAIKSRYDKPSLDSYLS